MGLAGYRRERDMTKTIPALAVLGLLGLDACSINTAPREPDRVVVQEAPAARVIQPGTTAIVPPGSVVVPAR
jgi:hypothetical protein